MDFEEENFWGGEDSDGKKYSSIEEVWKDKDQENELKEKWYKPAKEYWEKEEATDDGVLGSFGFVNDADIKDSEKLLEELFEKNIIERNSVLDCGAGIGRISKNLLTRKFKDVDLVENNIRYLEKAKELLKGKNIGTFYSDGLESFNPSKNYNCIWIQWVSSHLTDKDYVDFLKRCSLKLETKGVIFVKENISRHGFILDLIDSSVCRSNFMFKELFKRADLKIIKQAVQTNFPSNLLPVYIWILQRN